MNISVLLQRTSGLCRHFLPWVALLVMAVQYPGPAMGQTIYATPYTITTLAGEPGVPGTNDGTGSAARFGTIAGGPAGVALDGAGNLYVTDFESQTIRRVTSTGVVTTLAGRPGVAGTNDGTNMGARFDSPQGVAVDGNGNVYVADTTNYTIRKVALAGTNWVVTTLAGRGGSRGANDGTNGVARFYNPTGVAVDASGDLYVTDSYNYTIRKVTPEGTNWVVTTLAGLAGAPGTNDGTNTGARFNEPAGVAVDSATNLYVADEFNFTIRKLTASGTNWVVKTIAGLAENLGTNDGTNSVARFNYPFGVAVDTNGNVYVADQSNFTIRKATPSGTNWVVTTVAGVAGTGGTNDGTGSNAQFYFSLGVAVDTNGDIFVADCANFTIRKGSPPGSVPQPVLQPPSLSAGRFGFGITGLPNLAVDVQSSSDLMNWQIADTNYYVLVNGTNFFPGPSPAQGNLFYRVQVR